MRELRRPEHLIDTPPRRWLPLLRLALLAVPVAWLARRVDLSHVAAHLRALPLVTLATATGWTSLAMVFFIERWRRLLRAWGATPPTFAASAALVLEAAFWNLLPGGLVGDLARSDAVRHTVGGLGNALAALWFERLGGLLGLFAVGLVALALSPGAPRWHLTATALSLVGAVGLLALSLAATRSRALASRLARLPLLGARLGSLTPPTSARDLAHALLISLGTQGATCLAFAVVTHALSPGSDLGALVSVTPVVILFTFVPLTPAGVGQREAVFSMVYAQAGVAPSNAVAASITSFSLGLLVPAAGGLLALRRHTRRAASEKR